MGDEDEYQTTPDMWVVRKKVKPDVLFSKKNKAEKIRENGADLYQTINKTKKRGKRFL